MQEEATRKQFVWEKSGIRAANVAKKAEGTRCFKCGANRHIGKECPKYGKIVCYKCQTYGDHVAAEYPNEASGSTIKKHRGNYGMESRYGNTLQSSRRGLRSKGGIKRYMSGGNTSNPKRDKYDGFKGQNRMNYRGVKNGNQYKGNSTSQNKKGNNHSSGNTSERNKGHKN
ncbi:uncharacterized protein LOC107045656 [Diachasma alloeum]|uniref:uncharacterized protein LOC107045656 n=1 Tax=Diachasma alloeum TaxID=454923 RepID=UPI0007384A51|nr:uncharacterized protein LOC107045656 [Diachasma alloeum]